VDSGHLVTFYLGVDRPAWLARLGIPLFVSYRALTHQQTVRPAVDRWAMDSGAYTEITMNGRHTTSVATYARAVARYRDEVGMLDWAAPQDHMTEPWALARSEVASTIAQAQALTVENYLALRAADDTLPIIPVLQGQSRADYDAHIDSYARAGVDLFAEPLVGLGSVCRRQATTEIAELIAHLSCGLRLHGFGVKTSGLGSYGWMLSSSDSMAWSYGGRRINPCPQSNRKSCNHCEHHALDWRTRVLEQYDLRNPVQMALA
jgi:hypothetical protein